MLIAWIDDIRSINILRNVIISKLLGTTVRNNSRGRRRGSDYSIASIRVVVSRFCDKPISFVRRRAKQHQDHCDLPFGNVLNGLAPPLLKESDVFTCLPWN